MERSPVEDRGVTLRVRLQRILRTTQSQHEKLREIHTELDRALASAARDAIDPWVDRLGEALHSHFDLEQRVVFPILARMTAAARTVIDGLEAEHTQLLADLQIASEATEEMEPALSLIRQRLRVHEQAEERLIAEILGQMPSD